MSSGAVLAVLVPSIVGVLGAAAAWLRASAASKSAQAAHTRIDALTPGPSIKAQP